MGRIGVPPINAITLLKMERRADAAHRAFTENVIRKFGHAYLPFLDDPYS